MFDTFEWVPGQETLRLQVREEAVLTAGGRITSCTAEQNGGQVVRRGYLVRALLEGDDLDLVEVGGGCFWMLFGCFLCKLSLDSDNVFFCVIIWCSRVKIQRNSFKILYQPRIWRF